MYVGGKTRSVIKKYQDLVKSKSLNKKIFFVGKKENVLQILKSCDIFILTSNQEGMPNVLIEAMALKIPVVSTGVDGVLEVIEDQKNGYLVKPNDSALMIKKIISLLTNDEIYQRFKVNAYKTAYEKFDLKKMIKSYEDLFKSYIYKMIVLIKFVICLQKNTSMTQKFNFIYNWEKNKQF